MFQLCVSHAGRPVYGGHGDGVPSDTDVSGVPVEAAQRSKCTRSELSQTAASEIEPTSG